MDEAWQWLKENDPYFKSRKHTEYPYLSKEQLRRRRKEKEIPVSSLFDTLTRDHIGLKDKEAKAIVRLLR